MTEDMRIGVITHTTAGRGGIERVVELQVAGLRGRGHDVAVVTGPEVGSGWIARAVAALGLGLRRGGRLRHRFDVVLAHYQPSPWLAARSGLPFLVYFHMPIRALHPTALQRKTVGYRIWTTMCRPLASTDRRSVLAANAVAVPSPSVGADLERLYERTGTVLPLGVDAAVFRPDPVVTPEPHLLFVGRLNAPYKHVDWAYEVARRSGRALRVVGMGAGPSVPTGVDVVHVGYLEGAELAQEYRRAAVLLFPSEQEDFGLVPLEAMACGLPVIAWDDGHGPSLTMAKGSGGVLVQPYDLDAYQQAVETVLNDPEHRRRLAEAGPAWVESRFSFDRHLDELERLLAGVLAR